MVNTNNKSPEDVKLAPEVLTEAGDELGVDIDLGIGKVSEAVSSVAENGTGAGGNSSVKDSSKSTGFDFGSIAARISNLLFDDKKEKEVVLPKVSVQRLKVRKSLEKQTKNLIKEANRIQNARHFSADKLEQVVQQIRHLQKLIDELMTAMKDRIESLYKKFVIGKGI